MSSGHTSRATSGPAGSALTGTLQALAHSLRSQQAVGGRLGKSKSFKRQATAVPPAIVDELEQFLVAGADQWTFDAFRLDQLSSGHALSTLAFYLLQSTGLMKQHSIRGVKVARFLRAIEAGYQANAYHNAVHDLEHVGLTNDFLNNSDHDLAIRYNDRSPMENHHLAACFSLLQQPHLNFLSHFAKDVRGKLRKMVIELVLATDMKNHMAITSQFSTVHSLMAKPAASTQPVAEPHEARSSARSSKGAGGPPPGTEVSGPTPQLASQATGNAGGDGACQGSLPGPCEPLDEAERLLSLQVALKCADIGMIAEGQEVAFYDFVGTPMFQNFTRVFPGMQPMMDQLQANYRCLSCWLSSLQLQS
ncbi:phosphodiesterase [Haematococcus lacustris]|uniref:Phosphodiesterase n=1 Tax=Haematococcus lacustris TaxID=44745 RepID=A0A699Z4A2_HAELA|nr:phosphodiesterase [Haematococcus lacustris]